jgi:hypothetical protein
VQLVHKLGAPDTNRNSQSARDTSVPSIANACIRGEGLRRHDFDKRLLIPRMHNFAAVARENQARLWSKIDTREFRSVYVFREQACRIRELKYTALSPTVLVYLFRIDRHG